MRPVQIGSVVFFLSIGALAWSAGCSSNPSGNGQSDGGLTSNSSGGGDNLFGAPPDAASLCVNGTECPSSSCSSSSYTAIQGTVYDPAGTNPLPYVSVYIPQSLDSNGKLDPLPKGASCQSCQKLFTNTVLASAITQPDGTFLMQGPNIPVGQDIPLVVQTGKWRMLYHLTVNGCMMNSYQGMLRLPRNSSEGDLPDIAVSTGGADSLECLLVRVGVSDSEFVNGASPNGHIHIFEGGTTGNGDPGPVINNQTPISSASLWDSVSDLTQFDVVLLSCEGAETGSIQPGNLDTYVKTNGGRVFASHFHYAWFSDPQGPFVPYDLASWEPGTCDSGNVNDVVQTTLLNGGPFPKGQGMEKWMETVGASTMNAMTGQFEFPVQVARHNATVTSQNTNSTVWIVGGPDVPSSNPTGSCPAPPAVTSAPGMTQYFSWDEPIGNTNESLCGRIVYSDLHVGAASNDYGGSADTSNGVVPTGCMHGTKLSPQEDALEFMLFDLTSCLTPASSTPAPPSSAM